MSLVIQHNILVKLFLMTESRAESTLTSAPIESERTFQSKPLLEAISGLMNVESSTLMPPFSNSE